MRTNKLFFALAAGVLVATFSGCESPDTSGAPPTANVYYGVGFYDPWYYGYYDDDIDVVVPPPSNRPPSSDIPRPSHPIATPPPAASTRPSQPTARPSTPSSMPAPRPMLSIPSTPRVSPRR